MKIKIKTLHLFVMMFASLSLLSCFNNVTMPLLPFGKEERVLYPTTVYPSNALQSRPCCLCDTKSSDSVILMIPVIGEIGGGSRYGASEGVHAGMIRAMLDKADEDRSIKALLLLIDSPGGGVSETDLIFQMLRTFSEKNKLPVYAHIKSIGASGGYYLAMSAKELNISPVALTGSIGVIYRGFNVRGLMEKVGVTYKSYKSGANKDILSPFAETSPNEEEVITRQISSAYENFLKIIRRSRGDRIKGDLRKLADGRIYNSEDALKLGLVDSTFYIEEYLDQIQTKEKLSSIKVMTYVTSPPRGGKNLYDSFQPKPDFNTSLFLKTLTGEVVAGYYYLWDGSY